jgi:hypothetical protein
MKLDSGLAFPVLCFPFPILVCRGHTGEGIAGAPQECIDTIRHGAAGVYELTNRDGA